MRKGKINSAILEYIKNNPDCTINQMSESLGTGYTYIAVLSKQLFEEGLINYRLDSKRYKHFSLGCSTLGAHTPKEKTAKNILAKVSTDALIEELKARGFKGEVTKNKSYTL